jgi:hypothetical protein
MNCLWSLKSNISPLGLHLPEAPLFSPRGKGSSVQNRQPYQARRKSTIKIQPTTILFMGVLIQHPPATEEQDSSRRTIAIAVAIVLAMAVIVALLLRTQPQAASGPPAYAANLKLSDFKMSAAENFVGATVSYIDGTVTNSGNQTVTRVMVRVVFQDDMGQMAQREDLPLKVLKTGGPYDQAVDLGVSPLGRGQSQPFRLTFERISAQWNHQYPEISITDVTVK